MKPAQSPKEKTQKKRERKKWNETERERESLCVGMSESETKSGQRLFSFEARQLAFRGPRRKRTVFAGTSGKREALFAEGENDRSEPMDGRVPAKTVRLRRGPRKANCR
jgi:hypothetical protein